MRKTAILGFLVMAALAVGGCHHGHSSFNYRYSEGADCRPQYREAYVEHHRDYGHRSHGWHARRDRSCD